MQVIRISWNELQSLPNFVTKHNIVLLFGAFKYPSLIHSCPIFIIFAHFGNSSQGQNLTLFQRSSLFHFFTTLQETSVESYGRNYRVDNIFQFVACTVHFVFKVFSKNPNGPFEMGNFVIFEAILTLFLFLLGRQSRRDILKHQCNMGKM